MAPDDAPGDNLPLSFVELERRFTYHAPNVATRDLHNYLRAAVKRFAKELNFILGEPSREASLAFTSLEEASFWAHAHIARNVGREEGQT